MLVDKEETGSTNDDARQLALEGAPHGTAVLARRQLAGRGRDGRAFASPGGGMYLSVVLRPRAPPSAWGLLPIAAGLGVLDALARWGFDARLKWPNDVLLDGRKVGGILVESRWGEAPFAVVGVGLNLAATPADLPLATCLAEHGAAPEARAAAEAAREGIVEAARRLDEDARGVLDAARARCVTLGRMVAWEGGEGRAVDIDADGALVVESEGRRVRVVAGDVRVREKR